MIVMDYYPKTLEEHIFDRSVSNESWTTYFVLSLLRDIIGGIAFMHQAGIYHRDLKVTLVP